MRVEIQRNETANPIIYDDAVDAYTKGPMYCVMINRNMQRVVHKYPLVSLFRVIEGDEGSKR